MYDRIPPILWRLLNPSRIGMISWIFFSCRKNFIPFKIIKNHFHPAGPNINSKNSGLLWDRLHGITIYLVNCIRNAAYSVMKIFKRLDPHDFLMRSLRMIHHYSSFLMGKSQNWDEVFTILHPQFTTHCINKIILIFTFSWLICCWSWSW